MKVLITGVSGFIGQATADHLLRNSYSVYGSGRGSQKPEDFEGQYRQLNLLDPDQCRDAVKDMDAVIHCAGKAGTWGPFRDYYLGNVEATANLVKACQSGSVTRFINISSPSVYSAYEDQTNLKETDIPKSFINAYAETKFFAEQKVSEAHGDNLLTLSLRPRGVIGAGDRNWFPRIIEMRKHGALVQVGKGDNRAEFTSIGNLVSLLENCLRTDPRNFGEVYNVTNGDPVNFWNFIDEGLIKVGLDGERKKWPLGLLMPVARLNEILFKMLKTKQEPRILPVKLAVSAYTMTMNIDKTKSKLGYEPIISNEEAMMGFANWWLS